MVSRIRRLARLAFRRVGLDPERDPALLACRRLLGRGEAWTLDQLYPDEATRVLDNLRLVAPFRAKTDEFDDDLDDDDLDDDDLDDDDLDDDDLDDDDLDDDEYLHN